MTLARRSPRVLALGGLEPSGRAGLLADVELARALGAVPLAIATCLTAQGTSTFAARGAPAAVLRAQLAALRELGPIDAVKLGMVPGPGALRAIARGLEGLPCVWVIDPVVRTSKQERLSTLEPADYFAVAGAGRVLTPNLAEARWLLGWRQPIRTPERAAKAGLALVARGFEAVVVKGGHARGAAVDVVCTRTQAVFLSGSRLLRGRRSPRGTGCRFATALAVALANGAGVFDAARTAKAVVRERALGAMLAAAAQGRAQRGVTATRRR